MIPKPGKDHTKTSSYRPITLLAVLGKVFERLLTKAITNHLEKFQKLPSSQAGFRPHQSCQDQLLRLVEDGRTQIQRGRAHCTLATMFDIEKAFDKLWHDNLILKMYRHLRLSTQTIALVQSFLSDRYVQFKVGTDLSTKLLLEAGCPQGSILSPTLFNMSVSDIPQPTDNRGKRTTFLSQFADDIATWSNSKDVRTARADLQDYNDKIIAWCKKSRILLSSAKTQVILFKQRQPDPNEVFQIIDGNRIEGTDEVKFLGVTLDNQLNFKAHQKEIVKGINRKLNLFPAITGSSLNPRANARTGLSILKSMILPLSTYAPVVTCVRNKTQFREIDALIARATKLALHIPNCISSDYAFAKAGITRQEKLIPKLATSYITNPNRSTSIRQYVRTKEDMGQGKLIKLATQVRPFLTPIQKMEMTLD